MLGRETGWPSGVLFLPQHERGPPARPPYPSSPPVAQLAPEEPHVAKPPGQPLPVTRRARPPKARSLRPEKLYLLVAAKPREKRQHFLNTHDLPSNARWPPPQQASHGQKTRSLEAPQPSRPLPVSLQRANREAQPRSWNTTFRKVWQGPCAGLATWLADKGPIPGARHEIPRPPNPPPHKLFSLSPCAWSTALELWKLINPSISLFVTSSGSQATSMVWRNIVGWVPVSPLRKSPWHRPHQRTWNAKNDGPCYATARISRMFWNLSSGHFHEIVISWSQTRYSDLDIYCCPTLRILPTSTPQSRRVTSKLHAPRAQRRWRYRSVASVSRCTIFRKMITEMRDADLIVVELIKSVKFVIWCGSYFLNWFKL